MDEEGVTDDDLEALIRIEDKIKTMKVEWAKAEGDDAAFIESKIRDMEEFLVDAKNDLGLNDDTEMKDAAKYKKRGRGEVEGNDAEDEGSANAVTRAGKSIFGRFKKS